MDSSWVSPFKSTVEVSTGRHFSQSRIDSFKKSKEFNYTLKKPELNPIENFLNWLFGLFRFSSGKTDDSPAFGWGLITLLVLIMLAALYLILRMDRLNLFQKNDASFLNLTDLNPIHENIDFESKIKEALQIQNYNEAVRVEYFRTLKELNHRGWIYWAVGKSNQNYLMEMKNNPYFSTFKTLTYYFEYSFYGGFKINIQQYKIIEASVELLMKSNSL